MKQRGLQLSAGETLFKDKDISQFPITAENNHKCILMCFFLNWSANAVALSNCSNRHKQYLHTHVSCTNGDSLKSSHQCCVCH